MRPPRISNVTLAAILVALGAAACSGSDGSRASTADEHDERPPGGATRGSTKRTTGETAPSTAAAAPSTDEPREQPRVWLEPPGREPVAVDVEVARTPAETQRGLMFRRQMAPNAGMIFLFARPRQMTFWMRNTYIPLDMVFITSEMRVLGVVENATPETDDAREVEGISQYVLEVNAGFAREHGIVPGTAVRFEDLPPTPGPDEDDDDWEDDE